MPAAIQLALPLDTVSTDVLSEAPVIYTLGYAGWAQTDLREEVVHLGAALVHVRIAST